MAELSRFWTGTATGDAGPYSADNFADYMRNALYSAKADSGLFMGSGASPDAGLTVQQTSGPSNAVQVTAGSAHVRGYYYELTANQNMTISPNVSGNSRIDTVILRAVWATQTIRLVVIQGTPSVTPVPAALTQVDGTQWEIPLADVLVANGFVTIVNANITPRSNWANQGGNVYLYDVLNNSGGALVAGDVVVWDTSTARAVKTSTTALDSNIAGVWMARTAAGGYGRLLVRGIGPVNCNGAQAQGNVLAQSTTAKQAQNVASGATSQFTGFAFVLSATSGAGLATCYVDASVWTQLTPASASLIQQGHANYTTTSATFADIDGTNLILTLTPTTGRVMVEFACGVSTSAAADPVQLDIILDGTVRAGGTQGSSQSSLSVGVAGIPITVLARFTGLSIAAHTFKPQFAIAAAATATIFGTPPIVMRAWEY